MQTIKVNLGERSYDIVMGRGVAEAFVFGKIGADKYVIVTDSNVKKLHGEFLEQILKNCGYDVEIMDIPAGEDSKHWEMAGEVGRELARRGIDRDTVLVTFGGGVVGDIAGFVASFYKRGLRYIHIPTTLLAQVDSSIGGKTGVNIPEGKNIFGAIYQPLAVITDINFLKTLPEDEVKNGLAEVIKYAVIKDTELFEYLEKNIERRDEEFYEFIVAKSAAIKAEVVSLDERESELRKILNYGHTVGHAVEILSGHKIFHGQAVAIGMVYEAKIANKLGILSDVDLQRQNDLIKKAGLSLTYDFDIEGALKIMRTDKKNKGGQIYFVLPKQIGALKEENGKVAFPVEEEVVKNALK